MADQFVPDSPTIKEMQAGDTINYKGNHYVISAVGAYVNDGGGRGHRTVTISAGTFTVSTADTVLSSYGRITSANGEKAVWSQSVNA